MYTAMLNERGGFESDLTVMRLAPDRVLHPHRIGADDARRRLDRARHRRDDELAALVDVTSAYSVMSVMGPKARGAARSRSPPTTCRKAALPFATTREIDVGYARVRAARMSYVGGPGYELYVADRPVRDALRRAVRAPAREFGLRDAGYYTIDALRIEAGRRAWGAELGPDETPWEAGLGYAVEDGQAARVHRSRGAARGSASADSRKRLRACSRFDDPAAFPWGGEPILMDGAERRRTHVGRLQPQARPRGRDGLRAHRGTADGTSPARVALRDRRSRTDVRGHTVSQAALTRSSRLRAAMPARRRSRAALRGAVHVASSASAPSASLQTSTMSQPAAHAASARATMSPAPRAPAIDRSSLKTRPSKPSRDAGCPAATRARIPPVAHRRRDRRRAPA